MMRQWIVVCLLGAVSGLFLGVILRDSQKWLQQLHLQE
jgi:hypothetical protein